MNFEEKMKGMLDNGSRSYKDMIDIAKCADLEIKGVKEVYQIIDPVVSNQINLYRELHESCIELKADLLMRGKKEKNDDGSECTVVDVSTGRWIMFNKALDNLISET